MRRAIITGAVLTTLIGFSICVSPAMAQTTGSTGQQKAAEPKNVTTTPQRSGLSYTQKKNICYREGGLRRDLAGDDLSRFMQNCMKEVTASKAPANPRSDWEQRCHNEGASQRNLRGDQLTAYIKQCMEP